MQIGHVLMKNIWQYQRPDSHVFSLTFEMVRLDDFINIYLVKKTNEQKLPMTLFN